MPSPMFGGTPDPVSMLLGIMGTPHGQKAALDIASTLARPAKTAAAMMGYLPEGYRWMTPQEESKWMEDAALGFAGSVTPKVGIRAYHGSPHDFDKFSMSKIGTGEGAQSYGHGLYFAEAEPVARAYRDALAWKNQRPFTVNLPGNPFSGAQMLEKDPTRPGRMYEVNIRAKPEEFLDWDKPLSQQAVGARLSKGDLASKEPVFIDRFGEAHHWSKFTDNPADLQNPLVVSTIRKMLDGEKNGPSRLTAHGEWLSHNKTGADYYKSIASPTEWDRQIAGMGLTRGAGNKDELASRFLRAQGIPGIRYLDQGSRAAGDGSRNYVLFRDDIIDILRKYGIFGAPPMFGKRPDEQ